VVTFYVTLVLRKC